jgi:hypothetical protein
MADCVMALHTALKYLYGQYCKRTYYLARGVMLFFFFFKKKYSGSVRPAQVRQH